MPDSGTLYRAQLCVLTRDSNILFEFLVEDPEKHQRKVWLLRTGTIMVEPKGSGRMQRLDNPVKADVVKAKGRVGGFTWAAERSVEEGAILNAIAVEFFSAFGKKQARWALNNLIVGLKKAQVMRKDMIRRGWQTVETHVQRTTEPNRNQPVEPTEEEEPAEVGDTG